ncbi:MAG: PKD domain-containing protein [Bacteroidetes bacterium]|nr:PKD domain-containing protein [Bacteroidota bacterium]
MKKFLLLLLITVNWKLETINCFAQQTSYQEVFPMPDMDGDIYVIETSDGGFITTGQAENIGAGSCDIYVFKKDACGKLIWFKTYGGGGGDGGTCIRQTTDGGYIVSGLFTNGCCYDASLLKIDGNGNLQWLQTYGGGGTEYGMYVQQTTDGGYVLTGHTDSYGAGAADVYVVKTNSAGNVQWEKTFGGAGNEMGSYIEQAYDGSYIISGVTDSYGSGGYDLMLIKIDTLGALQWSKVYGGAGNDGDWWLVRAPITNDKGYFISSYTANYGAGGKDIFFIKTDSAGNVQWAKTYGGGGEEESRFGYPASNGDLVSTGYTTSYGAGGRDYYLLLTDSAGNLKWMKTYGAAGDEKAMGVQPTSDTGFVICGNTNSAAFGAIYYDIYFIKTDSLGNTPCYSAPATPVVSAVSPVVASITPAVTSPVAVTAPIPSIANYNPSPTYLCIQCRIKSSFDYCKNQLALTFYDSTSCMPTNWYWDFGDGQTTTSQNPIHTYSVAGTYTVQMIVLDNTIGCVDTTAHVVTVNTIPIAQFSFVNNVCDGTPVQFTDQSNGTISSWQWDFGDGFSDTIQNPSHLYSAPGTYNVQLTVVYDSVYGFPCIDSFTIPVNIQPIPVPAFTAPNVCFNNPAIFTDQSTIANGTITNWNWNFGDGTDTLLQNPSHTYNTSGTFTVTLIVTSAFGCTDTLQQPITINPLPATNFSSTTVCLGNPTSFTDGTTITSGTITTWGWNFADPNSGPNNISNLQNPSHTYTAAGTFMVVLTTTSDSGCQTTTILPVVVMPLPVAAFTVSNECLNSPTVFTDLSSVPAGNILQWDWAFGDGNTSSFQNPSHTYLGYGTYMATLIVTSSGGCKDTITDTVTVYPIPVVNFKADSVCQNDTTPFYDLSFIPAGSITGWNWNFGDGNSSSLQNPTHVYASSGNYNVTLSCTSNNNCTSLLVLSVVVFPLPLAEFSYDPGPNATFTDPVQFNDLSTNANIVQWWWNFGDSNTAVLQYPIHLYSDTGIYLVTLVVVSDHGCIDTIQHPIPVKDFTFYIPSAFTPNADGTNEFFFGVGIGITNYEMWIFDRWGNLIFQCKVNGLPQTQPCWWNGKVRGGNSNNIVQGDVYVWKVKFTSVFKKEYNYIGTVTVVK